MPDSDALHDDLEATDAALAALGQLVDQLIASGHRAELVAIARRNATGIWGLRDRLFRELIAASRDRQTAAGSVR